MLKKIKMPERFKIHPEIIDYIAKVILPALAAISIKIALEMKYKKISLMSAFLSLVIGVLTASLTGSFILKEFPDHATIIISLVAISSEKITHWFIFKVNINITLDRLWEAFTEVLIKMIKK